MRMRFSAEDDDFAEFRAASDALTDRFGAWVHRHEVAADPSDIPILLDWRYSYGDGALDEWTRADVEEFLLEWCPRKLSADPDDVAGLPLSVAAWVDFLAHEGLLAPAGDPPSSIRELCAGIGPRFRRAMADPRNFGMAKSLVAGGAVPLVRPELPASVGPVRMPRPEEIGETVRDGQALPMARALARFCAAPGRKLTAKGNLRLADARELVPVLGTGDDPDLGGYRTLRSATELPGVSTWIEIGLAAGVVRRHKGRLVAVDRFARLGDEAAHSELARAGIASALSSDDDEPALFASAAAEATDHLLAMLLDGPVDAADAFLLVEQTLSSHVPQHLLSVLVPPATSRILDVLGGLDLITIEVVGCDDCPDDHPLIDLTAAGVPHAVDRVRQAGVEVVLLPDPVEATAAQLAAGILASGPGFVADVRSWLGAQPDHAAAIDELAAAVTSVEREPAEVLLALTMLDELRLPGLPEAVHRHRSTTHAGLLIPWLVEHGQVDGTTVDPAQMARCIVDVAAVMIDLGSPDDAVDAFPGTEVIPMLRDIWRLDHPRLPEVLELVGRQHPVKAVAKEARRSLMKTRSRQ